jgi:hypothetical protein
VRSRGVTGLRFSIGEPRVEPSAVTPTLLFPLRVKETTGAQVHAIALRCQIRIEARQRTYAPREQARLADLFGAPARWSETLRSLVWTHLSLMVPAFRDGIEVPLPVACTYDLEVAGARYFQALEEGEVLLLFLFSGSVFVKGPSGFQVEQVPWDREAICRLPVRLWREMMERYFPGGGWIRLRRESLEALGRFKSERALLTWDDTVTALVEQAQERAR